MGGVYKEEGQDAKGPRSYTCKSEEEMMIIVFITINSGLLPLIENLCAQI